MYPTIPATVFFLPYFSLVNHPVVIHGFLCRALGGDVSLTITTCCSARGLLSFSLYNKRVNLIVRKHLKCNILGKFK